MIANYGKVAYRNFNKNKTYVLINILSMSIGLACCIVSYLNYEHNRSFDSQHANIEQIYRINYQERDNDKLRHFGLAPQPITNLTQNIASINQVTKYSEWHGSVKIGDDYFDVNTGYVSDNFLNVFTFPMVRGSKEGLNQKSSIYISEKLALRLYDDINVIGISLVYSQNGQEKNYIIEGILKDFPSNTSFNIDVITHRDNLETNPTLNPWHNFSTTFLLIEDSESVGSVTNQLKKYAISNAPEDNKGNIKDYYLDPLEGMAGRAQANDVIGPLEIGLPWIIEVVPAIISLLILLIACFTFTNTSIASAASRLKEIGVRKVLGGRKQQIVGQFLMESLLVCTLSILLAIPLAKLLAVQYNELLPVLELKLVFSNNIGFFAFLIALVAMAGLIAGAYPALYLSKFQPSKILKGNLKYKSVGRMTKILLTCQFAFAMMTITSSVLFIQNAHFQSETDLGFDTEQAIVLRFGNVEDSEQTYRAIKNALSMNPKIIELAASVDHVARRYYTAAISHESEMIEIVGLDVGPNYAQTVGLSLTKGRDFNEDLASDYLESVVVNKLLVKQYDWENPIGKKLVYQDSLEYYVIGVVEDFYFDDFSSPIQPLWMRLRPAEEYNYLIAKADKENVETVMAEIKMAWRILFSEEVKDIKPPEYAKYKGQIINGIILKVLVFMGILAAIMSMIGFFSLVSLNLFGRMKEIGVRRVLGSTTLSIIKVINRDYIVILAIGIVTGALISHFFIPLLMSSLWAYHTNANLLLTMLSILLMVLTCAITVGLRVVNAAKVNPVELLKDE
jgi:ABC-type antimicrobial peptide transport system permease subunit